MLANHFRRFLVLCVVVGLVTAVSALTAQAIPSRQEDRPSRTAIEDIPHYPLAETSEVGLAWESVTVVPASKVAFQSYRSGNWDIFVGNDDGAGQTAVTSHIRADIHPHLNRGNTAVVYASRSDDHDYEIYRVHVNGSNRVALTNNEADDGNPQWSPDGTKIVFESYRDGQAEIYVMNANGSNQVRLTNNGAFDGMPSWSPDGSKIAFSSNRSGAYRIWVMNADGSNPVRLSNQPYSFRPQWSPDGSKIAYDADGNNDGWQELWWMNVDGSDQQAELTATNNTDLWVGSWSPDGRYIAITRIHFVYYQGNWYWDYAYQEGRDINLYNYDPATFPLSQSDVDWHPRWQTSDGQPPVSQVHALDTQSRGPIPVSWSGADAGGSGGIANYDVQVKAGANGNWTNWLVGTTATTGHYPGTGGNTYYFRARARDLHHGIENWPASHDAVTTVEAMPPHSQANALPSFSRHDDNVVVTWGGYDPGGSGILTYDVQYRINSGPWINWRTGVTKTVGTLAGGNSGETYFFRTRATDQAHNIANWPVDDGDTSTTFYAWGIRGVAYDNAHTPASGITVNSNPTPMAQIPSDMSGTYGVFIENVTSSYSVSWAKSGYGSVPETLFSAGSDAQVDIVLPPADNAIANWGFEEGFNNWNSVGSITPVITDSSKHSGIQAAFLGPANPGFAAAHQLSGGFGYDMAVDSKGNVHALWRGSGIYYAWRNRHGDWSAIETIGNNSGYNTPQLLIDSNDTLHVTWDNGTQVFYKRKPQNGAWSTPENITVPNTSNLFTAARIAVDQQGIVHAFVPGPAGYYWDYFYRQRLSNGVWSSPRLVSSTYGGGTDVEISIDHSGTLHAVWEDTTDSGYKDIFYIQRASSGSWSTVEKLSNTPWGEHSVSPDLIIDDRNTVHLVWVQFGQNVMYYRQKPLNENWSSTELLFQNVYTYGPELALGPDGKIHLTWPTDGYQIQYARRSINGRWSYPQPISLNIENVGQPQIMIDANGLAHVIWGSLGPNSTPQDVYYTHQLSDAIWSMPLNLSHSSGSAYSPSLAIDVGGYAHVIWLDTREGSAGIYYSGPSSVDTAGEAILSQNFTIPVTITTPTLSFLYRSGGMYSADGSRLTVLIDDGTTTILPIVAASQGKWTHYSANLANWAGETITLTFKLEQEASAASAWAIVDEVTVGSTYSDNWVSVDDGNAPPGQQLVQTITYSNRGGAAASGVTITYTLPAGMTFVSASVPPASTNPLVWHLPDLPAKSGPLEILVTAQVNANTPAFTTLTSTAVITTNDPELELLNNQAEGHIYTATFRYLPVILR
ncbi:MAG: DUF11 domain-containing protein [Chloroflexi bacterium]|nr:PD40 domain-containing protein [Ardenticatenaceae bacterium]MBL1129142.1 DUF11 domain-containing protein [Chloroflexota bacterium]NOG35219.1 DUF11 domain-containing protein [Chloroflexota bacterium]